MAPEITNNLDKIIEACKEFQVQTLYVFGSAARQNDFNSAYSDIDFLADFKLKPTITNMDELAFYFENIDALTNKFKLICNRNIDLIIEKNIKNKYLLESINKDKKLIYAEA